MYANKLIDKIEYNTSLKKKLVISKNNVNKKYSSDYYSEEVRRKIIDIFGEYELYNGGPVSYTHLTLPTILLV